MFGLWFIRDRHLVRGKKANTLLAFAILIAVTPLLPVAALPLMTLLTVSALILRLRRPGGDQTNIGS